MKLKIEIFDYWHVGSGHGSAGDLDAIVLRDPDDLPYLPGRSLKGLLRDACILLDQCEAPEAEVATERIFGLDPEDDGPSDELFRDIHCSDARLPSDQRAWLNHQKNSAAKTYLFDSISSTALESDGVARNKSLRKIEVSLPMMLEAEIDGLSLEQEMRLKRALPLIRELGKGRNRGLGRCRIVAQTESKGGAAA